MCLASIVMTDIVTPSIVDFTSTTPEVTRSKPPADRLLAGKPEHAAHNYFSDATGRFFAGVWESSPGRWRVRYTENEFCHAGASFVIPAGFSGTWEVLEPTSKLYVIYEPAP